MLGKLHGNVSYVLYGVPHREVRTNLEWKDVTCTLGAPFYLVCCNEFSAEVAKLVGDLTSAVLARMSGVLHILLFLKDFLIMSGEAQEFIGVLPWLCVDNDVAWSGGST
ncbi:hypothetical protein MUBE_02280 [Mycobacterium uberis]|uniref:Uncharacterized protein n=1 Tax=Mycobacterium uberis TaxID=2162698 RepID=A0A3E1HJS0_9MYCO|nr:hypothetical protein MUBE_02280 [Mycobacterium uberis]